MRKIILMFLSCFFIVAYSESNFTTTPPNIEFETNKNDSSTIVSQPDYSLMLKKTIFMVIGLIGIIFLTIYILKRFALNRTMHVNQTKHIKIIERRSISPKTVLYLVQIGDKKMLLSESQLDVRSHQFLPDEL